MNLKAIPENFVEKDEEGNTKIIITVNSVYDDYKLFDLTLSDGSYLATLAWIGSTLSNGQRIMQPAITTNSVGTKYLSYDGRANFIVGSDLIVHPSNGKPYPIIPGELYFFKNDTPTIPETKYSLDCNNKSIRMNNISIFNSDFSQGIMMDLRTSMEGAFSDPDISGYIIVLSAVDQIN